MRAYRLALVVALAGLCMIVGAALLVHFRSASARSAAGRSDRGGAVWGASYFPNVPLTTHDGRHVRFFDLIKDKVVVVNFIYTTCPDSCPMETARLLEVYRILGGRVGKDVFFYSITIDPENDTQPVLAAFAKNWGIPPGWSFLTGREADIVRLRKTFGVYNPRVEDVANNDHNLSLLIGNQATGRWMKRSPFENPYILANQLGSWLHNWKTASKVERDYAEAPEVRQISSGEDLFRTRCASCHTIGRGDVEVLAERRIGPDLFNVTLGRDREWLVRWLKEPDKLLAEKDPLALALFAQYKNIPMPNLRLNDTDAAALLDYLDEESRRVSGQRAASKAAPEASPEHHHHDHDAEHARGLREP